MNSSVILYSSPGDHRKRHEFRDALNSKGMPERATEVIKTRMGKQHISYKVILHCQCRTGSIDLTSRVLPHFLSGLNDVFHLAGHTKKDHFRMLPILWAVFLSAAALLTKTLSFGFARVGATSETHLLNASGSIIWIFTQSLALFLTLSFLFKVNSLHECCSSTPLASPFCHLDHFNAFFKCHGRDRFLQQHSQKKKGMKKGKLCFINCLPRLENETMSELVESSQDENIIGNKQQRLLLMCDEENLLCWEVTVAHGVLLNLIHLSKKT